MGALLALIPTKDKIIGVLVVGLAILVWHWYDKYQDAVRFAAEAKAQSKVVEDKAKQDIIDFKTQYTAVIATMEATYAAALSVSNAHASAADKRLHDFDAYRAAHPLQNNSGTAGGEQDPGGWLGRLTALEPVAEELAHGLEDARAQRDACVLERSQIAGK
jgi:hypothetical protein